MMAMQEVASILEVALPVSNAHFNSVSIDTRTLQGGELFVAISGPNFDANDFVETAAQKGAVGAVVSRDMRPELPVIIVDDTVSALATLATSWRRRFSIPVIGVTGSNGKTTVKEMIGCIMQAGFGDGVISAGNLNNHIGLPLSILGLRDQARFGVFEMGMNHEGEIDHLTRICKPTVALVNNAAAAHLQGLGSVDRVAHAKAEIFAGLDSDGVAIINLDDEFAGFWRERAQHAQIRSFGLDAKEADYKGELLNSRQDAQALRIRTPDGDIDTELFAPGRHNLANATAACACAMQAGAGKEAVVAGLARYRPVAGRLKTHPAITGVTVIDDTYNANPASVRAAIDVLMRSDGLRVLVLGQMAELGADEATMHEQVGVYAASAGVDVLYGQGDLARESVRGFDGEGRFFESTNSLVAAIKERCAGRSATVLIKGSRSMDMQLAVTALLESLEEKS